MNRRVLDGKSCPIGRAEPARPDGFADAKSRKVLTRIFIEESGDLVVTDLWEEIRRVLGDAHGDDAPSNLGPETGGR